MTTLDLVFLDDCGLGALDEATVSLPWRVKEELGNRVGQHLCAGLTGAQVHEFEAITDGNESFVRV
jgi:hypothetical protein